MHRASGQTRPALQLALPVLLLPIVSCLRFHRRDDPGVIDVSRPTLAPAEADGYTPVFVDAFLSAASSKAWVIFSTKQLRDQETAYDGFATATWRCTWTSGAGSQAQSRTSLVRLEGIGDGEVGDAQRKTLVIHCPAPVGLVGRPVLGVEAVDGAGSRIFKRSGIRVRRKTAFEESKTALCTMVIQDTPASPFLADWVRYHLSFGFQQIVVYVEDPDISWAEDLLARYLDQGQVRLVHFYFGSLSDTRSWMMQQAQEQHCLYSAKGRVRWLGHSDIDEYFQVMDPSVKPSVIGEMADHFIRFLDDMPRRANFVSDIPAISVQSQLWYFFSRDDCSEAKFLPCDMTCKAAGYDSVKTKLIMSPDSVDYFSVHMLTRYRGQVYHARPWDEIRLNHFKYLPNGSRDGGQCSEDISFKNVCRTGLGYKSRVPGQESWGNAPPELCRGRPHPHGWAARQHALE